jgi:uncharacterized 2Fe-2S/4Fe-4S cluster protein (DUF4445 family)
MPIQITFVPSGRRITVQPGATILETADSVGLSLQTFCGGQGTCGKCKVRIISGHCTLGEESRSRLGDAAVQQGYRLACEERVEGNAVIEIPPESTAAGTIGSQILTADAAEMVLLKPWVRKSWFALTGPNRDNAEADLVRLKTAIGDCRIPYEIICRIPAFLRDNNFSGTALFADEVCVGFEAGDTRAHLFGIAFDIGTTTIVGTLVDLTSGNDLLVGSRLNPQVRYGDDVIARISLVRQDRGNLKILQESVISALNEIIEEITDKTGVSSQTIYEVTVAGNSTMQQIFCGIDPSALGEIPFVAAFQSGLAIPAGRLGLLVHPAAHVYCFPQIGGFVGGDTVAGMIASRIDKSKSPILLVDIGTNGEIVVAYDGKMLATSTAAGPAFEGARISQGMRAAAGAIEKVFLHDGDLHFETIGNVKPIGLCGSALIDFTACMLDAGILDIMGRILGADELPAGLPDRLRQRVVEDQGQAAIVLARAEQTGMNRPVLVRQNDIRQLQLGVGAIRAGITIALHRIGLVAEDLSAVLLAGAFGNYIRRDNAVRIGLLPSIDKDKIRFIGNASSLGAKLALLSMDERSYAEEIARNAEHIDLSLDTQFQEEFAMAMIFPERKE